MRALFLSALLVGCADPITEIEVITQEIPPDPHGLIGNETIDDNLDEAALAEALFATDTVQTFSLEIDESYIEQLRAAPDVDVPATFRWGDLVWHDVAVHIKGNGSFRPIDQKPSLKIEFDTFVPGQEFFGMDVLVLNNMISDPTKLREVLAYDAYRSFGIPAVRAAHSTLMINDESYGLYAHMEDVDERMLAQWFELPEGPLFELFDVLLVDADIPLFELESGPDDRTALQGAADALELDREAALLDVRDHVEMDQFIDFYAMSGVVGQFDAYPFNDPTDDVHLYVEPATDRIHFIPHGLDESMAAPDRHALLPGASLLGQACYFTTECGDALQARTWDAYDLTVKLQLSWQVADRAAIIDAAVIADERDEDLPGEVAQAQDDLVAFWLDREALLWETIGPRPGEE